MTEIDASASTVGAGSGQFRGSYAKTEARRQEILKAAFEVFSTSGYRAGSLKDVAERVGLSKTGVLHHFPSKEALLEAVLTVRDEDSVERSRSLTATGVEVLHGMVEVTRHNVTIPQLVALHCVLSAEATDPLHPAYKYFRNRYEWLRSKLTRAFSDLAEEGKLHPGISPATGALQLIALMDGLQVQWLLDNGSVDMPFQVATYLTLVTTEKF